jgi:hypothetical protein
MDFDSRSAFFRHQKLRRCIPPLHSLAIRASSRAFPAGCDGIAPGYACISTLEMRPMTVEGGDKP